MAIDFDQIQDDMADEIASAITSQSSQGFGTVDVPAEDIAAAYTWSVSGFITTTDTSEVEVGNHIRIKSVGKWYEISNIVTDTRIDLNDKFGFGFQSSTSPSEVTTYPLPDPPTSDAIKDSLGTPIAEAVRNALETFADDAEIRGTTSGSDTIGPGVIS